ncbi:type IV secretion protein Rhs [Salmonella enterica]|nr:type IV secretion protein Rhs [Salmonella enterica subsp. enterica]EBH3346399.1 type IV secretion protein Rhs [Salmonella enterica]EEP3165735.1 type IV secretion protein Rhs [Salmonella enterica subsp. houtenae serovar 43:z4,z32:-]EBH6590034.1 type IV secretion protein Rhs [Salmonella enterica]EBL7905079.1 type IV secretion protein Rhs [Salmonella enterica]
MTLAIATPVIAVCDNHGITIRTLNWNRVDKDSPRRLLVTHTRLDTASRATVQRDPRRFAAWRQDDTALPNLSCMASLTGQVLKRVSTDSGWQVTRFDAASHAAWSIDSRGAVHTQAYDTLGRPQSGSEQLKGEAFRISWRHAYTDTGSADANAQKNNLRGLCVQRWDDSGLQTVESVALSGAIIRQTQQFLLSAQAQPDWPEDDAGRQALLEDKIYLSTISADARGNSLIQTDAMGNQQSWRYDVSSHVKSQYATLSDGKKQTLLEGIVWSAASQILEENSGNGVTTTYRYEPETQRLSAMSALRADSIRLQDLDYGYDNTGNLISITDNTIATCYFQNQQTDGLREFTYDALYQLLEATGRENAGNTTAPYAILPAPIPTDSNQTVGYARSYRYDDSGNLLSLSHQGAASFTRAMAISDVSNRSRLQNDAGTLTPDDVDAGFDACGNLLNLQVSATASDPLIWSASNHLQTVNLLDRNGDIQQSDREIYQYSAGMRMRKQTRILTKADSNLWTVDEVRYLPGLELRRHWQETITGDTVTSQEATEELHVITTQAGRAGIRVLHWKTGKPDSIDNDQARWQISDNIYALELDAQGQTISREEYYPFGGTAVWAARSELETSYKVIRYSGKERDGTGLYYYGYRYYAPWLCRWTAADPGQEIDGLNLYRMVRNNPLTLTDESGLAPGGNSAQPSASEERFKSLVPTLINIVREQISDARQALEGNARVVPQNSGWAYLQNVWERWNPLNNNPSSSTKKPNEINNETKSLIKDYMGNDSKETIKILKDALEKMDQAAAALNENSFRNINEDPYTPKNAAACVGSNEHILYDTTKNISIYINYEETGKRHLYDIATVIIHEMTHLVLKTKDYCNSQTVPFPGQFDGKSTKKLRQYANQPNNTPLTGADNIANLISLIYYSQAGDTQTKSLYTRYKQSLSKSGWQESLLDFSGAMPEVSWPRVNSAEIQRRVLPVSRIKPASVH